MIRLENVSKVYRSYNRRSDRIREWLSHGDKKLHREIWALRQVSLEVPSGDVCGIVGLNGAGKSTLLKILAGTTRPTTGTIHVEGRIAALLELGTGFHPELSGRENVMMNGALLGLNHDELLDRIPSIQSFAELGDFFDAPVRTYSSGMYVRLAFSLAASVDPQVLIIDEALSVGDAYFQQKCLQRIRQFREAGVTILLVSHDLAAIKMLCNHAALLDHGQIVERGGVESILELYNAMIGSRGTPEQKNIIARGDTSRGTRSGNGKAEILGVEIQRDDGTSVEVLEVGRRYKFVVDVQFNTDLDDPTVGILIRDRLGYDIFGTNTKEMDMNTGVFPRGSRGRFVFDCLCNLGGGQYTLSAATHSLNVHTVDCYDWGDRLLVFDVLPNRERRFLGVTFLDPKIEIEQTGRTPG